MAGFEDLADEARARAEGETVPGTASATNSPIGADGSGTAAASADPQDPAVADTDLAGGDWARADRAGSDEGGDGFGPEGTRSEATGADRAEEASGRADPFDGGAEAGPTSR